MNSSSLESCQTRYSLRVRSRQKKALSAANHSKLRLQGISLVASLFVSSSNPFLEGFASFGSSLLGRAGLDNRKRKREKEGWPCFRRQKEEEQIWKELRTDLKSNWIEKMSDF